MEQKLKKFKTYSQIGTLLVLQLIVFIPVVLIMHYVNHPEQGKFSTGESILLLLSLVCILAGSIISSNYTVYSIDEVLMHPDMFTCHYDIVCQTPFEGGFILVLQPVHSTYARDRIRIFSIHALNPKELSFVA